MMIAHATYKDLDDSDLPASLNPRIIQGLLRDAMGFEGLVMTDDLDMGAILNHYGFDETMRMGIEAGNDFLMLCHRVTLAEQIVKVLAGMSASSLTPALERMAAFKKRLVKPDEFSESAFQALDKEVWNLRVATLGAEAAAVRSPEDGKRSPVEMY
jgi:beta-N-acetylhexosaminidase